MIFMYRPERSSLHRKRGDTFLQRDTSCSEGKKMMSLLNDTSIQPRPFTVNSR